MSFMSGPSCSAGANPLAQMAKQQSVDRSLQHEQVRQGPPGPHSMRQVDRSMSQQDQQQFHDMESRPNAFQFGGMQRELPQFGMTSTTSGQVSGAPWAAEFQGSRRNNMQGRAGSPAISASIRPQNQEDWTSQFSSEHPEGNQNWMPNANMGSLRALGNNNMVGGYRMSPMYTNGMLNGTQMDHSQNQAVPQQQEKWEELFKQVEASQEQSQTDGVPVKAEEESQASKTDENAKDAFDEREFSVEDLDDPAVQQFMNSDLYPPGWDDVWDRIKGEAKDDGGIRTRSGPELTGGNVTNLWDRDFNNFASSRPGYADYEFVTDNPYIHEDDPFAMGVALMDQGAKLSIAALCFEAALQRDPNHVEAWRRLGDCQAQNEVEQIAFHALERAVKLDPYNEAALMSLAISYTNEGYENAASATLERWLATKYPDLVAQAQREQPQQLGEESRSQLHDRVAGMFLKAAQLSPDGASMDADVQVGLGVLFYRNEDYTKAVDCFRTALSVRPDDALLWNRLGATLANAMRAEEAIDAYYQALKLRPSFVRARCNLGVSCINIGCYKEAAEHLLSALSLHETSEDGSLERSTSVVETLRRVFLAMDRRDLLAKLRPGMKLDDFRSEFNF